MSNYQVKAFFKSRGQKLKLLNARYRQRKIWHLMSLSGTRESNRAKRHWQCYNCKTWRCERYRVADQCDLGGQLQRT